MIIDAITIGAAQDFFRGFLLQAANDPRSWQVMPVKKLLRPLTYVLYWPTLEQRSDYRKFGPADGSTLVLGQEDALTQAVQTWRLVANQFPDRRFHVFVQAEDGTWNGRFFDGSDRRGLPHVMKRL